MLITCEKLVDTHIYICVLLILHSKLSRLAGNRDLLAMASSLSCLLEWLSLTVVVFKMHILDNSRKEKTAR